MPGGCEPPSAAPARQPTARSELTGYRVCVWLGSASGRSGSSANARDPEPPGRRARGNRSNATQRHGSAARRLSLLKPGDLKATLGVFLFHLASICSPERSYLQFVRKMPILENLLGLSRIFSSTGKQKDDTLRAPGPRSPWQSAMPTALLRLLSDSNS